MQLEVDDAIVLLLGAPTRSPQLRDQVQGITRLEKMLFLLEHEFGPANDVDVSAEFTPHNYGPFSAEIYKAVDILAAAEMVTDSATFSRDAEDAWETANLIYDRDDLPDSIKYATRDIALTDRGRRYYHALTQEVPVELIEKVGRFKDRFGAMPLRQLIRYVYEKPEYEAYLTRSTIRDEIIGRGRE